MSTVWEEMVTFQRRVLVEMDRHLVAMTGRGLDDYDVLHQLSRVDGPSTMGDLATRLLVANSSCHRIVGRLVTDGFVEARQSDVDRRSRLVQLTGDGRRLHRKMAAVHGRDIEQLFTSRLTDGQLATLVEAFEHLAADPAELQSERPDPATTVDVVAT